MARTTKTIAFDTEKDADLLDWIGAQKNQSLAVREALRRDIAARSVVTLETVYRAILDLDARVQTTTIQRTVECGGDAPGTADAARALDRLGL